MRVSRPPSHGDDQGGRRPRDGHDPLSGGWLVPCEFKVDDAITSQPVQERMHVLVRLSIRCGRLSDLLLRLTDAWSRRDTRRQLSRLLLRPLGTWGLLSALLLRWTGAWGGQGARRRLRRRPLRLIDA